MFRLPLTLSKFILRSELKSAAFLSLLVLLASTLFHAKESAAASTKTAYTKPASTKPASAKPRPRPSSQATNTTFRNPLKQDGADPWLTYYKGWYYLSTTTAVDVKLRRARHLRELKDAPDQVVWKDETPTRSHDVWAAEFHRLESGHGPRWYLYYTASDGKDDAHHRLYVAEGAGTDPLGPYTFKAQLQTDPQSL